MAPKVQDDRKALVASADAKPPCRKGCELQYMKLAYQKKKGTIPVWYRRSRATGKPWSPSAEGETSAQQDPKAANSEVCSPKKNKGTTRYGTEGPGRPESPGRARRRETSAQQYPV